MMATDLANVRAFFHLLPIEFSLPVVLVARLAKRTIFGLFEKWELDDVRQTWILQAQIVCDLLKAATEELDI
jgi:hypothetical protein